MRKVIKIVFSICFCGLVLAFNVFCQEISETSHYTDNGNGTVTDKETGLMWKKCGEGQIGDDCSQLPKSYKWNEALQQAQAVNTGGGFAGYNDWRLPSEKELSSIVEKQRYKPAINLSVFPNTQSYFYWSSSPDAYKKNEAWFVHFANGEAWMKHKNYGHFVRLVRSGQ